MLCSVTCNFYSDKIITPQARFCWTLSDMYKNKNASFLNRYIFRTLNDIDFLFSTVHATPFLYHKLHFWSHAPAPRQYCNVRYPTGFKPAITLGRSNQIASNSVCRYRGPIPIDLYCSLILVPSVTEIQVKKLRPYFPARFAQMILANRVPLNVWEGICYIIGTNRAAQGC